MAAQPRGFLWSLFDRTATWLLGFPPERCSYSITPVKIPIGSDISRVELLADLYLPIQDSKPLGTILVRSPYGRAALAAIGTGRAYAPRGYQVLLVSCRGTLGSGGEFDPFRNEVDDGLAVVAWMREQEWYSGKFATMGGSYLGWTQYALMTGDDPMEDMVTAVIHVGPHDMSREWWGTGALNMDTIGWANLVVEQEKGFYAAVTASKKVGPLLNKVPLAEGVKEFFGDKVPWLERILSHGPNLKDPYYERARLQRVLETAKCPILLGSGWNDLFIEQTVEQYTRLNERGLKVGITIGPWDHVAVGVNAVTIKKSWEWIEEHLAGQPRSDESLVQYYVTGAQEWRKSDNFPPPSNPKIFYLHAGKKLSGEEPGSESESDEFTYDPHDPTPTVGGNTLFRGGSKDDSQLALRPDVLTLDSEPLLEDLEVIGRITAELTHSTDNPHADILVRISDVDGKGKSKNITQAYKRLDITREPGTSLHVTLDPSAHRFVKGNRIRLVIAGGSHPHYYRNLGVSDPNCTVADTEMQSVKHTLHIGGANISRLTFPVVDIEKD